MMPTASDRKAVYCHTREDVSVGIVSILFATKHNNSFDTCARVCGTVCACAVSVPSPSAIFFVAKQAFSIGSFKQTALLTQTSSFTDGTR